MSRDYRLYIDHIREEVEYLLDRRQDLTREEFVRDETLKRAVVRSLEIIGEATKSFRMTSVNSTARYHGLRWRGCATY